MSKMKTHRGAAKRFKVTKSGKVKHRRGFRSHILTKKSAKRKRQLRGPAYLDESDARRVREVIGKGTK